MKTAVAYYSLGGTTRSYARAEAKARNADLIELKPRRPYNLMSAFVRGCLEAVSYTHLDVYKRQVPGQQPDLFRGPRPLRLHI